MSDTHHDRLSAAARLANPWGEESLSSFDPETLKSAVTVLEKQSVSLMGLRRKYGNAVCDTLLEKPIARDRDRYRRERSEYERIRQSFTGEGVESMLFKSAGLYPSFHYLSSNLDVIVPEGSAARARRCLVSLGYVELVNVEEPKKFLFRRFPGDGSSYAFHLHEVVGWGVPFVDNGPLWANARAGDDEPDIVIPRAFEALLITTAHWFYEDKALSLGNLFLTANALRELDEPLGRVAAAAARRGWEEGFWSALDVFDRGWERLFGARYVDADMRNHIDRARSRFGFARRMLLPRVRYDGKAVAEVPFWLNKIVYYRKVLRDLARTQSQRMCDVMMTLLWAVRWKLHIRSQKPILVALGGVDGSGKTVQAARLADVMTTCDIRARVMWSRGASSPLVSMLMKAGKRLRGVSRTAKDAGEAEKYVERRALLRRPFDRFVFSIMFATDLAWTHCVRVRLSMLTGKVVICDRYVIDALVDFAMFAGTEADKPPRALRLLAACAPRPTVSAILDVDPAEALRRKPDEGDTEHLAAAREGFLTLAGQRGAQVISGDRTIEEIQAALAREALNAFYSRYGTTLNGLLWSNPEQINPRDAVADQTARAPV